MNKFDVVTKDKPTVNDIARHAGVSLATVDRVINTRPGVRKVTIERVTSAIQELGYIRDTAAANLARRRVYRFFFLLPDNNSEFINSLQDQIVYQSDAHSNERTFLDVRRVRAFDPQAIVNALDALEPNQADGVSVIAPETPAVRDAIDRARERGLSVIALLSDLPSSQRDHFIGIDNTSAGQTAAQLMGRFIKADSGRILVLANSRLARDHLERRHGFDSIMSKQFPQFEVLPSVEAKDDEELSERQLPNAFKTWPDIRGIYTSYASNPGLIQFLRKKTPDVVVIAHELTPLSRNALQDGEFDALISQDLGHIVRSAVRLMRARVDAVPYNALQERIRVEIFLKENLPPEI
ncbi:MAG: LacI family transcriptional regulator [Granulosicoccus sp.]|jgi:LacI family transcriptional regulator